VPCRLVDADPRFRDAYCLHPQGDHRSNDRGSMYL
jgi:hypothetical protein